MLPIIRHVNCLALFSSLITAFVYMKHTICYTDDVFGNNLMVSNAKVKMFFKKVGSYILV